MNNPRHILILVTSHDRITADKPTGVWFEEFATPYARFLEEGYRITVASPKGGRTPIDPRSIDDSIIAAHPVAYSVLQTTTPLSQVRADDFDALFIPGGHGTMYDLPEANVGELVGAFARQHKPIGAVCHGPAGLVNAYREDGSPLVRGLRVTAFTNSEEDAAQLSEFMPFMLQTRLEALGAVFIAAPDWADHVETDDLLVTGQNPQSGRSTADALIQLVEHVAPPSVVVAR